MKNINNKVLTVMKKIDKLLVMMFAVSTFLFTTSCEDINVLENEQYIKQVYIVGASDKVWVFDVPYGAEPQQAYISVATGGSKNIDKDVVVTFRHNDNMIDWYNYKYMPEAPTLYQELAADKYTVPSMQTTIKSGEVYARLPFSVNTEGLHCDSLYAITFEIETVSVSEYEKNETDTVLLLNFNFVNEYSGMYQLSASRYKITYSGDEEIVNPDGSLSALRTLKAVDANTVRFFNEARAETRSGYASNEAYYTALADWCLTFTKGENNSFDIKTWENFTLLDGECVYDNGTFTFRYDYKSGSTQYRIEGTLIK
jgi:hypothetical protein